QLGPIERTWYAPTLLWINASDLALTLLVVAGIVASLLLVFNSWPKLAIGLCTLFFLSCIGALQDFSSYQSDGMLLEAGFLSFFFAPRGGRPGLGASDPPSRFSLFMLRWEWFRIYFESGLVKILSGDPTWRNFTAMDNYYQNGPLPSWMGWYVQQLPHWYHAGTVVFTFAAELVLVWAVFLPRRIRVPVFFILTALQIGIILTANYTFLNYLVLVLGVLLLDDRFLMRHLPARWTKSFTLQLTVGDSQPESVISEPRQTEQPRRPNQRNGRIAVRRQVSALKLAISAVMLTWIFYVTTAQLLLILFRWLPLPTRPIVLLEPFRIANQYGLFAVMTRGRYEIEFQGSNDGQNWTAYPFRYKPLDLSKAPGIYAPYQPRFDW